jgi:hypothetical protein
MGYKDPSTNLWVLPITPDAINQEKLRTSQGQHDLVSAQLQAIPCMARAPQFPASTTPQAKDVDVAMFTHFVRTRANAVKFSHQSMCNPKNLKSDESLKERLFKRVSKSVQRIGHKILKSKPCNSQRPYETTKEGYQKHAKSGENKG